MPHINDSNHHEGTTLFEPTHVSIHTHCTLLPSNKHFSCFTTFRLYDEIHFYTADGPGPFHWPLVSGGLAAGIQGSHRHGSTSVSGQELKPCFKPLQAEATQDHFHFEVGW